MADIEWTKSQVEAAGFERAEAKVYEHVQVGTDVAQRGCCTLQQCMTEPMS